MSKRDEGKVRRTRGSASGKHCKVAITIDGKRQYYRHMARAINELAVDVTTGAADRDHYAASDDADGTSAAKAATSPAAGTARPACADAANERDVEEAVPCVLSEEDELPPGVGELPMDGHGFVQEVHALVNLHAVWARLVKAKDLKIVQRAAEKLIELDYLRGAARNEDRQQGVEIEVPAREYRGRN